MHFQSSRFIHVHSCSLNRTAIKSSKRRKLLLLVQAPPEASSSPLVRLHFPVCSLETAPKGKRERKSEERKNGFARKKWKITLCHCGLWRDLFSVRGQRHPQMYVCAGTTVSTFQPPTLVFSSLVSLVVFSLCLFSYVVLLYSSTFLLAQCLPSPPPFLCFRELCCKSDRSSFFPPLPRRITAGFESGLTASFRVYVCGCSWVVGVIMFPLIRANVPDFCFCFHVLLVAFTVVKARVSPAPRVFFFFSSASVT